MLLVIRKVVCVIGFIIVHANTFILALQKDVAVSWYYHHLLDPIMQTTLGMEEFAEYFMRDEGKRSFKRCCDCKGFHRLLCI